MQQMRNEQSHAFVYYAETLRARALERIRYMRLTDQIGTPGSCFAVRIVSDVFTLATFGAGVSLLVRNS